MEIFGNKNDVRIVVFSTNHTPSPGKLKKLFSSPYALVYKGHGHYRCMMHAIEAVFHADAELRGTKFDRWSYGENIVVLDASASYNVFTVLAHSQHIIAYYQLNSNLYKRLDDLASAIEKLKWRLRACDDFVRAVEFIRDTIRPFGEKDSVAESLNAEAFQAQWGKCGQAGLLALKRQLAAELLSVSWQPSTPMPKKVTTTSDMAIDRTDSRKAA